MLQVVTSGGEFRAKELLEGIKDKNAGWRAQYFRISLYTGELGVREASKVALNLLGNLLRNEDGGVFFCHDGDILIVCKAVSKKIWDDISYQLTYLLADNASSGANQESFETLYDLSISWPEIHALVLDKIKKSQTVKKPCDSPANVAETSEQPEALERDIKRLALVRRRYRAKPVVLLVDDDMLTLRLARSSLGGDFGVVTAGTGGEAYNTYLMNAPDVVFMDIGLPDMDGHHALKRIMALDPEAHVVMLSGNSYREDILKAIQAGAKGFIGKPFTREKLLQAIEICPRVVNPCMVSA